MLTPFDTGYAGLECCCL